MMSTSKGEGERGVYLQVLGLAFSMWVGHDWDGYYAGACIRDWGRLYRIWMWPRWRQ